MTEAPPSERRHSERVGFWFALIGAVAFSGKAIVVKLLIREGVDPITALGLRMILAAPGFALMAWWGGRARQTPSRKSLLTIGLLGVSGYYLASTLDFMGLAHISASLERLILYTYPTIVLFLGRLRGHSPIRRRQWLALGLSYLGVLVAFGAEARRAALASGVSHEVMLGGALVLGSSVSYAIYIALSGEVVGPFGALRLTGWASGIASVLCITQFLLLRPALVADPSAWLTSRIVWLSVLNATLCTAVPMWMVMRGIELIGSAKAAQIGMFGPLSTLLLAVLLLGEPFTTDMLVGTALVLGGIALLTRRPASIAASAASAASVASVASAASGAPVTPK
jgi:drug/metabolite transporter (DMT)-like permease